MHAGVRIGARDRVLQLGRQFGIDRVERFGSIERDAGDAPVALIKDTRHDGLPASAGAESLGG